MKALGLLYAPAIVLFIWALLWHLGVRGDVVVVAGLVGAGLAFIFHTLENLRRYRDGHYF